MKHCFNIVSTAIFQVSFFFFLFSSQPVQAAFITRIFSFSFRADMKSSLMRPLLSALLSRPCMCIYIYLALYCSCPIIARKDYLDLTPSTRHAIGERKFLSSLLGMKCLSFWRISPIKSGPCVCVALGLGGVLCILPACEVCWCSRDWRQ